MLSAAPAVTPKMKSFKVYTPLTLSTFSIQAGKACAIMVDEIIKEYNNE